MKKLNRIAILCAMVLLIVGMTTSALATLEPSDAVVIERVFNDSFASILTVDNSFPSMIAIDDEAAGPLGWANLHIWRFASGGSSPQEFANEDGFRFGADLTITGSGDGEAGLSVAPWWSGNVDGRFNVRTPDGEVAVFGGRLPFYSFTANNGVTYVEGTTVHLEVIYRTNSEMNEANPATIEYIYDGISSGPLAFDEGNPAEADPHGTWGLLSPWYAGGYMQYNNMSSFGEGANFHVEWEGITVEDLGSVVATDNESWDGVKALFH